MKQIPIGIYVNVQALIVYSSIDAMTLSTQTHRSV